MKNIRIGIFETNSSSEHTLSIIKENLYDRWKNHEIVLKKQDIDIDNNYEENYEKLQEGDSGLFRTWGNFFLDQINFDIADIRDQKDKNIKLLEEALNSWVTPQYFSEDKIISYKKALERYKLSGILEPELYKCSLYMTPEEYYEFLKHSDCDSPFFYKGEGVVVLGHYFRS